MKSCIDCTCAVSPQCEFGSGSSNEQLGWMTSYTGNKCASWLHCGSACDGEGHFYPQMSWDIGHKTFDLPSLYITSSPWLSPDNWKNWKSNSAGILSLGRGCYIGVKITSVYTDMNNIWFSMHLSQKQYTYCLDCQFYFCMDWCFIHYVAIFSFQADRRKHLALEKIIWLLLWWWLWRGWRWW